MFGESNALPIVRGCGMQRSDGTMLMSAVVVVQGFLLRQMLLVKIKSECRPVCVEGICTSLNCRVDNWSKTCCCACPESS